MPLAHQGAWDEILYFAVPAIAALWWVRRLELKAKRRREAEAAETPDDGAGPATNMPAHDDR